MLRILWVFLILLSSCSAKKKPDGSKIPIESLRIAIYENYDARDFWFDIKKEYQTQFQIELDLRFLQDFFHEKTEIDSICKSNDLIFGLNNLATIEIEDSLLHSFVPSSQVFILDDYRSFKESKVLPIGRNYLCFLFQKDRLNQIPKTLGQLQDGEWYNQILWPDAQTTSLGRASLYWSIGLFQEFGYGHFWRSIKRNIYQINSTADETLNRFLSKETPICLSFLTSVSARNAEISIQIPREGYFEYIEGIAISKQSNQKEIAEQFIEYALQEPFQQKLSEYGVLLPIHKKIDRSEQDLLALLPAANATKKVFNKKIINHRKNWVYRWKKLIKK